MIILPIITAMSPRPPGKGKRRQVLYTRTETITGGEEARPDIENITKLYQMQRLRSEVVHSFRRVTKQEAQDALTTITGILQSF